MPSGFPTDSVSTFGTLKNCWLSGDEQDGEMLAQKSLMNRYVNEDARCAGSYLHGRPSDFSRFMLPSTTYFAAVNIG